MLLRRRDRSGSTLRAGCAGCPDDLGVRPDVDEEGDVVGLVRALRQDDTGGVGTDMAGDTWQYVDPVSRTTVDSEELGPSFDGAVGGEREGRPPRGTESRPRSRWCMIGFPTSTISRTFVRSSPASSTSSPTSSFSAVRIAFVRSTSPPGFIITYDTRLIRSSPNLI